MAADRAVHRGHPAFRGFALAVGRSMRGAARTQSTELDELTREFHLQLSNDSAERPLVLFLDAVDQLGGVEGGHSLDWLPQGLLPRFVKLILSCVSDRTGGASAGNPMAVIRGWHLGDANVINLDALSREEAATLVFDRWLPQHGRRVTTEQRQLIERQLERPECRHPLYLKILFEEARLWRSYDAIAVLGQDVPGLLKTLFDRLEQPVNHGSMVSCTMAYLAASRRGLAENEILELLFRDEEYRASLGAETLQPLPLGATRIPIAVWSRLRHNLATYVSEHAAPGATVLNFYHLAVAEYARERFLHDTQRTHARLAAYFDTMSNFLDATGDALANARKSDELLWHAIHGGEWDLADRLYGTTDFLEASIRSGLLDGLVSDSDAALSRRPSARIEMVRNALLGAVPALRARPEYALQTLRNAFAFASPREEATPLADAAEARLDDRGLWLAAETPSPDGRPGDAGMWELGGRGAQTVSAAEGVLHVGTPKGAVESRDLQTGRVLGIRQLGTLPVLVLARNRRGRFAWIDSKALEIATTLGSEGIEDVELAKGVLSRINARRDPTDDDIEQIVKQTINAARRIADELMAVFRESTGCDVNSVAKGLYRITRQLGENWNHTHVLMMCEFLADFPPEVALALLWALGDRSQTAYRNCVDTVIYIAAHAEDIMRRDAGRLMALLLLACIKPHLIRRHYREIILATAGASDEFAPLADSVGEELRRLNPLLYKAFGEQPPLTESEIVRAREMMLPRFRQAELQAGGPARGSLWSALRSLWSG